MKIAIVLFGLLIVNTNAFAQTAEVLERCEKSIVKQIKEMAKPTFGEVSVDQLIGSPIDENTTQVQTYLLTDQFNIGMTFKVNNTTCDVY